MTGKISLFIMGCSFVLFLFPGCLFADPGVNILMSTGQGSLSIRVSLDKMQAFPTTFNAVDPNFQKDGLTPFTGITLKKLLSIAKVPADSGVTVVGSDQYIGYIPFQILSRDQALLAWQMNKNQMTSIKGGPFKIIYRDEAAVHGSCYVWYVDSIIAGGLIKRPSFQLTCQGTTRKITIDDISSGVEPLDETLFSIPSGCKKGMETDPAQKEIKAIALNRLIDLFFNEPVNQVTFIPFAGRSIQINKAALSAPIYITLSLDGKSIHPSFGGPFSVIFPVEQYQSLASIVPESGALFFLDKIIVD